MSNTKIKVSKATSIIRATAMPKTMAKTISSVYGKGQRQNQLLTRSRGGNEIMKTIKSGTAAGDSHKKTFYCRVSTPEQGSRASARQLIAASNQLHFRFHRRKLEMKQKQTKGDNTMITAQEGDEERKTVLYTRVSTLEQGKYGLSKSLQIKAANDYLKRNQFPLLSRKNVYVDFGSSSNLDRPALSKLIDHVKEGKIKTILVLRIDRLSRNIKNFVTLMDIFDSHNVSLRSVEEPVDTSSTTGRFIFSFLRLYSDFERVTLRERQMAGWKRRRQRLAQEGDKQGG